MTAALAAAVPPLRSGGGGPAEPVEGAIPRPVLNDESAATAALFDALSYAAQCTEARKREALLRRLRAI